MFRVLTAIAVTAASLAAINLATTADAAPNPLGITLQHFYPDHAEAAVVCPVDTGTTIFATVDSTLVHSDSSFVCTGPDADPQRVSLPFDRVSVDYRVGTFHDLQITVSSDGGEVTGDFPGAVVESPPAPDNRPDAPLITLTRIGFASLAFSWSPPPNPHGTIEAYRVRWTADPAPPPPYVSHWSHVYEIGDPDLTDPFTATGLAPSTVYTVSLAAYNENGRGPDATLTATTTATPPLPHVPRQPHARPGSHQATLFWHPPLPTTPPTAITGYQVHRFHFTSPLLAPAARSFVFRHLKNDATYTLFVRARNGYGWSDWTRGVTARPHAPRARVSAHAHR